MKRKLKGSVSLLTALSTAMSLMMFSAAPADAATELKNDFESYADTAALTSAMPLNDTAAGTVLTL